MPMSALQVGTTSVNRSEQPLVQAADADGILNREVAQDQQNLNGHCAPRSSLLRPNLNIPRLARHTLALAFVHKVNEPGGAATGKTRAVKSLLHQIRWRTGRALARPGK